MTNYADSRAVTPHHVITAHIAKTGRDPPRKIELAARNVAGKRPEFAQIEVNVTTVYPRRVAVVGGSVLLGRDAAFELAAALLGVGVNTLRDRLASVLAAKEAAGQ